MGSENPQEPFSSSSEDRPPVCVYDLFFDLPHPTATTEKTRIIDPPVTLSPILSEEMYKPDNISRLTQFAFPEYDEVTQTQQLASEQEGLLTSQGRTFGANLSKYDIYSVDFVVQHHTFSILLSDGRTRVHGHVRRYLPQHSDSSARTDVGRRRPRAMILITRAIGGERFYTSLLKTVEAFMMKARVGSLTKNRDPVRNFLHAAFNNHANMVTRYTELRRHGVTLNFTQAPKDHFEIMTACDIAKAVMKQNEEVFRINVDKLEFGPGGGKKGRDFEIEDDRIQFYLPYSLQPGYECIRQHSIPEDKYSPITPLLRYIGPSNFLRVLSALLCERRIILISNSITRLSMCVKAASAALSQGLLMWEHALIPVVPPHLIPSLVANVPYLVGVLSPFVKRLRELEGLADVLCVNVDKNELKTFNMANPRTTVPDLLKKMSRKSDQSVSAAETLANDLDEIFQADQKLWFSSEGNEKTKEGGLKALATSDTHKTGDGSSKKKTIINRIFKKQVSIVQQKMSLEEKRQYATSVDAAAYFGKMIRANFQKDLSEKTDGGDDDEAEFAAPKYSKPSQGIDVESLEACSVAENEGGEEDVRAALTCFFMYMYGDMGMYLSETNGTFWLDRRKFLLRKKQEGEKENSPTFLVLRKFSSSKMFSDFVNQRISDMIEITTRERFSIMPHHIPLFDICCKYLSVHRLEFSLINVRKIVANTVISCTRHLAVERSVALRNSALALTSDAPFDGNVGSSLAQLIESCRECNTNLSVVMSVIWHRLNEAKNSVCILLALQMLKNLLLHGPLTTISEALDGVPKIYELKSYSNSKNMDQIKEVRRAADQVYEFVVDISLLYVRRRRVAFTKAQQPFISVIESWGCYAANKVPLTTDSQKMHALFRPDSAAIGNRMYYDAAASVAPSIVSNTPSIMALRRIDEHRMSGMDASHTFDDEVDEYQDDLEVHENMSHKQAKKMESSLEEFQNNRYAIDTKRDDTSNIGDNEDTSLHGATADELFSQDFDYAHDEQEMDGQSSAISASDDAASLLQSFNSAVSSSHTGSYYGSSHTGSHYESSHTGSYYASSHTGSYHASSHSGSHFSSSEQPSGPRKSRQAHKQKAQPFLRESTVGKLHAFSFPAEKQNTIHEDESEALLEDDFSSNFSVEVSEEGGLT
mmetsp:Transcript_16402/g.25381  ORF Transcript_16402/g.25381 Transcript_16402/m.25381 type:complete len:1158 (+) Transcript_16402:152-3625(+)